MWHFPHMLAQSLQASNWGLSLLKLTDATAQRENRIEQRLKELGSLVQEQILMYFPWILGCSSHSRVQYDGPPLSMGLWRYPSFGHFGTLRSTKLSVAMADQGKLATSRYAMVPTFCLLSGETVSHWATERTC